MAKEDFYDLMGDPGIRNTLYDELETRSKTATFAESIPSFDPPKQAIVGYMYGKDVANALHAQQASVEHDQKAFTSYKISDPLPNCPALNHVNGLKDEIEKLKDVSTEGRKDDSGKNMMSLLPPDAIEELAKVYTLGANKYSKHNYLKGMDWSRIQDALLRHYYAWAKGEINDPTDGQHHLASVAWCALALIMYQKHGLGTDDRWLPEKLCKSSS